MPHHEAAHDAGDRQLRCRDTDAERVEKAAPGLERNGGGNGNVAQLMDEGRDIR
jgi:hypothetical protein